MTYERVNQVRPTLADLAAAGAVVVDGGMGTLLQDKGLDDGGSGELWNVDRPDAIREAHRAHAEAGARILTTNTFGGTKPRLDMHGLGKRVRELNEAGARLAREVADEHGALVAGDLGPTGELMAPLGTMDAEAAIAAAREVVPDLPIVATLSFDTNLRSMMGVRPADAVTALAAAGVDAVGANCGRGPGEMAAIAALMADARPDGLLLIAQSNAGLPQVVGDHFEYDATPDDMARHAIELRDLGIDLIGACCGSTPDHVGAISRALA